MSDNVIVVAVLALLVLSLIREWVRPVIGFSIALSLLVISGIITSEEAFSGFSNEVLMTIAALYIITGAIEQTTGIESLIYKMMGKSKNLRTGLIRMMIPVSLLSGFVNNTPIVSMMVPQVGKWAASHNMSASRLLMPLSFASIFGGILTLVGTSTNLAVSGLLSEYGLDPFSFFELTVVGLPIAIIGTLLIVWRLPKDLPERNSAFDESGKNSRDYIFRAVVEPALAGKTVAEAGLRSRAKSYLFAIDRSGSVFSPVKPSMKLRVGDVLNFTGQADAVKYVDKTRGLRAAGLEHVDHLSSQNDLTYHEAIIDNYSPLVGRTLKTTEFRSRYDGAVVAIHRSGERVNDKLGRVRLKAGDTLLIISDEAFSDRWAHRKDFLAVFPLNIRHTEGDKHGSITIFVIAAVLLLIFAGAPLPISLILGASILVALKTITFADAMRSIQFEVLILIGAAFGVAAAVSESGVADQIASIITNNLSAFGPVGVLAGVVLATILLTELVTNSAAGLLMLPIAIAAAQSIGVDPRMMAIAVAIAASASFLSPVGYQTNTMVYGPGGYKFTDYFRLGWLPTATVIAVILVVVPRLW